MRKRRKITARELSKTGPDALGRERDRARLYDTWGGYAPAGGSDNPTTTHYDDFYGPFPEREPEHTVPLDRVFKRR